MTLNTSSKKVDFLTQLLIWVLLLCFGCLILYFGKVFFTPLLFGLLIAMIIYHACKKI
jgi:predicted PurR-regulated permease PerM